MSLLVLVATVSAEWDMSAGMHSWFSKVYHYFQVYQLIWNVTCYDSIYCNKHTVGESKRSLLGQ